MHLQDLHQDLLKDLLKELLRDLLKYLLKELVRDLLQHLCTSLHHHRRHLRLLGQRAGLGAWMVVALARPWRTWQSTGMGLCQRAWKIRSTDMLPATSTTPCSS